MSMRVTIIPADGFVSVDGEGYHALDLSVMPSDVHAIQWYGTDGEVEYQDNRGRATHNEIITDLTLCQPALDVWSAAKAALNASELPVTEI
jgi:hypothetical protein